MTLLDSVILGIIQGLTEFIPVSSSAHLIIIRDILGIQSGNGLAFDAVLQLATVLAVLVYFWKDILSLIKSFVFWVIGKGIEDSQKILILSIIIGTIPAIILGLLLESYMDTVFRTLFLTSVTLVFGSILFFVAEKFAKQNENLTIRKGFIVGLFQTLALVPGMSRSGMTISGGLFTGLSRETATRFSFLLSFPIILGSGLKKLFDLIKGGELSSVGPELLLSSMIAFIVGIFAIHFLIKYLKTHSLKVFAVYRVVVAVLILIYTYVS
jgi:undecaprenyl-diphosphatase